MTDGTQQRETLTTAIRPRCLYLAALAMIAAVFTIRYWRWDFDDAYIIYRYVQNLFDGNGWVFNPGQRYNACTSALHPIVLLIGSLVFGGARNSAHVLGGAALFVAGASLFLLTTRNKGRSLPAVLGAAGLVWMLAANQSWGLETHLLTALLLVFAWMESESKPTWYLLGLLVLVRPEAGILAILKALVFVVRNRTLPWGGALKACAVVLPWYIFSVGYFAHILPETLGNKMWQGSVLGPGVYLEHLGQHLTLAHLPVASGHGAWTLAALIYPMAAWGLWRFVRDQSALLYVIGFAVLQQAAYVVLNVPGYHWYFAILDTALYVAVLGGVLDLLDRLPGTASLVKVPGIHWGSPLAVLVVTLAWLAVSRPVHTDPRDLAYRHMSEAIVGSTVRGTIAALEVGTIAYHSKRPTLDFTGLTGPEPEFITRQHLDRFFELAPEVVVVHMPVGAMQARVVNDPRFQAHYVEEGRVQVPGYPELAYYVGQQ